MRNFKETKGMEPSPQFISLQKKLHGLADDMERSDEGISMLRKHRTGIIRPLIAGVWSTTQRKNLMVPYEDFEAIKKELLKLNKRVEEVSASAVEIEKNIEVTLTEMGKEMKRL